MGGSYTYNTDKEGNKCIQNFIGKPKGMRPLGDLGIYEKLIM
jgi:hypothetical protein